MSIWTNVDGYVTVPKLCRKGVKDLISDHFYHYDCGRPLVEEVNETDTSRTFRVIFSFCHDGAPAATAVQRFCDDARALGFSHIRVEATIVFY